MSINRIGSLLVSRGLGDAVVTALPEIECLPQRSFDVGGRMRIKRGVFEGVEGRLVSYLQGSRIVIAVDLNCQGVSIEIDDWMVESIDV